VWEISEGDTKFPLCYEISATKNIEGLMLYMVFKVFSPSFWPSFDERQCRHTIGQRLKLLLLLHHLRMILKVVIPSLKAP
jgi:hypothetical protein